PAVGQALRWRWRLFDLLTAIFFTGAQGYSSSADYPDCEGFIGRIGTGICTPENNNELCGYDGGDCCWCDCDSTEYPCEEEGDPSYNCIDPESTCKEEEEEEEEEEGAISAKYPDCDGVLNIGTGMCSPDNNNEQCGYDGGDCCWCDCNSSDCEEKGDPSYDCIDPESKCKGEGSLPIRGLQVDNTGVPTPSPTTAPIADGTPSSTFSPTATAMPVVLVPPGVSTPTDPSSDGVPWGPVVGGVAGGLVIVAIILAVGIKTGLLKNSRHSNTGPTPAVPVEPVYPAALRQYPSQSSGRPTTQYPGAYQYPAPMQ
ncbi:unnamed protein product, partial [Ectocarpus sp. 12 AP-2014]